MTGIHNSSSPYGYSSLRLFAAGRVIVGRFWKGVKNSWKAAILGANTRGGGQSC